MGCLRPNRAGMRKDLQGTRGMGMAMKNAGLRAMLAGLLCTASAWAQLPARDLTVELRQVEEGKALSAGGMNDTGTSYSAGSGSRSGWESQMVPVRNGEKASLQMQGSTPMQWVQSVSVQPGATISGGTATKPATGASGAAQGSLAGINNALTWFDAGQTLSVQAKWPGGNKPALVVIEAHQAAFEDRVGSDLPTQSRASLATTVTTPLAQWTTIAATGPASGSASFGGAVRYSSDAGHQTRQLLQIRVMAP